MKFCKWCGKEITKDHDDRNIFCSRTCSAYYSNSIRKKNGTNHHSEETKKKISAGVKRYLIVNNKTNTKNKLCKWCGKEITVPDKNFCNSKCRGYYVNSIRKKNGTNHHTEEDRKKISDGNKRYALLHKKIKLCKVCGQEHCDRPEICKQYLIRKKSINLSKVGFDFSKYGTKEIYSEYDKLKEKLILEYVTKEKSLRNICDEHNMTCETSLVKILDMYGIQRRSFYEASISRISRCETNFWIPKSKPLAPGYKHGWYTTWDGQKVYFRSSYEKDYCEYLDSLKIHYEMENIRIKYFDTERNKIRISIPDFYIPSKNLLVEIKSEFTYTKQNMIDRFRAYKKNGYDYKLIMEHKDFGKRLPKESNMTIDKLL